MTNMKQKKLIKNTPIKQKTLFNTTFLLIFFLFFFIRMGFEYKENEEVGQVKYCSFFYSLQLFP